ncbi:hypothetical protein [Maritimibacter sp. UBA3975]|uniref:hypothetical protein n=1 Tax=Maritimibacter sp. UBA3975 TaxID=1946833 RepID=UPI000C099C3F|nr:hypothetical protein [Maritimibacter sp. UBA3975]MAM62771.1 hypothetical protein [Maritimibacter sp.]|tara:strand:- start:1600 stop:2412 length:813 start_codon:yes stop_codon:yes gene_type:complete
MTLVIVHAGYHKTGTTSLQDFMSANRDALAPWVAYFGKQDFFGAGADARIYAQRPFPWRLARFRRSLRRFLRDLPDQPVILLSRETFSGGMPGHHRVNGEMMTSYYGPSLRLARTIISELRRRFGRDTEIVFFYTTREREAWIRSVHGHLLRSIRLTDDFDTFRNRFPALAAPAEEAERMRGALAPVPVVTAALEDWGAMREGPAGAVLNMLGVPEDVRATLAPVSCANTGQSADLREAFLALNRSDLSKADLKAAKARLIEDGPVLSPT